MAKVWTDAEIQPIFQAHSAVTKKMKAGGQSAERFARIRNNEITLWYKRVNEYLKNVQGPIYLGINNIYHKRFMKNLSTYNQAKIKTRIPCEYSNISGIYQAINHLEKQRQNKA